jgi:hypothetical protein
MSKISLEAIWSSMQIAVVSGISARYAWNFEAYVHSVAALRAGVIRMYPYNFLKVNKSTRGSTGRKGRGHVDGFIKEVVLFAEVKKVICKGHNLQACIESLQRSAAPGLYWYPAFESYPAVDAVLFLRSSKTVIYIQTTVGKEYSFNRELVKTTHDAVASIPWLKGEGWSFEYVVLVPSMEHIKTFKNTEVTGEKIEELEGNVYVGYIAEVNL